MCKKFGKTKNLYILLYIEIFGNIGKKRITYKDYPLH